MKIRCGFVSNSSSTSFFFMFKQDDKDEAANILIRHKENFNLSHYMLDEESICTGDEVVNTIIKDMEDDGPFPHIDTLFYTFNTYLENLKKAMKLNLSKTNFLTDAFNEHLYLLNSVKRAKDNNFEFFFLTEFGNEIDDDDLNFVMEMKSKYLNLREEDLFIITRNDL